MDISRRRALGAAATLGGGVALGVGVRTVGAASAAPRPADSTNYLVGCGIADMTGAVAGQGMMGYSEADQVAEGRSSDAGPVPTSSSTRPPAAASSLSPPTSPACSNRITWA